MNANPLLVRCGAFGDMVLVTPLIRLLAARYGRPVDIVSSGSWTVPLLQHESGVGRIQLVTSRKTPYLLCPSQWSLVRWLRSRGRGPVYLCDADEDMSRLLRRAAIPSEDIVGRLPTDAVANGRQRLWPDRWLMMGMRNPEQPYPVHDIDPLPFRMPMLEVGEKERRDLVSWRKERNLLSPLVLFQPGNKRTHKRGAVSTRQHPKHWPPESWAMVARSVWARIPDAQIVLCGSSAEHAVLEEIRRATGGDMRLHNLAGDLPIPRLLALLEVAHSMVSVDTGPAHAAAALACPLVVLFGNAPRTMWEPVGPGPVYCLGGDNGQQSRVRDIPEDSVMETWNILANEVSGRSREVHSGTG